MLLICILYDMKIRSFLKVARWTNGDMYIIPFRFGGPRSVSRDSQPITQGNYSCQDSGSILALFYEVIVKFWIEIVAFNFGSSKILNSPTRPT